MTGGRPALRGEKHRWLDAALRDGLQRPSAAWFAAAPKELLSPATAAAAVHLALAPRGRACLLQNPGAGAFTETFRSTPGLLPALVLFDDQPTGDEIWRRYHWRYGAVEAPTAPYTKVQRAGRTVPLGTVVRSVARTGLDDVARIETGLAADGGPDWWADPSLNRWEDPAHGPEHALHPPPTRIGLFCERVGTLLLSRLDGADACT